MAVLETCINALDILKEDAEVFLSEFTKVHLKKNDVFVERGKVCDKIGVVEKGLMKVVFDKNGQEVVFGFAFENNFVSDYYSFITKGVSDKAIICIEDTELYVITKQRLWEIAREHAFLSGMSRKVNEQLFLKMHDRLKSLLLDSPAQRYQQMIEDSQGLVNKVPQYLIASYLNVQPETISRIRKKISSGSLS
ncbi:Crp/Fnr family transcriptional regulator [Filimonas lacunae]|nr:Crp/Fnr family transcriptional regulator [Filimonas lacunae]BAV04085.1 Crp/Fnr family transcriptional regulator [Filimonas lacunae]